jgi:uncharacterized membrane protein YidH (DUF202 family)
MSTIVENATLFLQNNYTNIIIILVIVLFLYLFFNRNSQEVVTTNEKTCTSNCSIYMSSLFLLVVSFIVLVYIKKITINMPIEPIFNQ